ncbi:histidine phosphotransferase [Synechococcus sp. M16CYN]|uniref:histidine phosphotransferase n=1 Tax=Synechococcus sp. M16CYN TaxID=3103139 RepID=UPI00324B5AD8
MPFNKPQRATRRRSSAGPVPPRRPLEPGYSNRQTPRPTFLTLRDHGKVFVADMPHLSDGQLSHVSKEADEVLASLERRIQELEQELSHSPQDRDTLIKASTKRDITRRFLRAIQDEQEQRRNNPAVRHAAGESLPRTFLEVARHRLPGATFDSLLQEALTACEQQQAAASQSVESAGEKIVSIRNDDDSLPVVVSPTPESISEA